MVLVDLDKAELAEDIFYGGDAGSKEAVYYNGEVWMVKYPKSTRDYKRRLVPFTTSPLSEYLGSQIYQSLGMPVQETMLGIRNNRVVVACKDFTRQNGDNNAYRLSSFHEIKNQFMASDIETFTGTGSGTLLDEVLATIDGQRLLKSIDGVKERFWDMFVVDAFIGNGDRNNGNWGVLIDIKTRERALAPVFDNGNAFFNKKPVSSMIERLKDDKLMIQDAYINPVNVFVNTGTDSEARQINPFAAIEHADNADCNDALLRFVERVNMAAIAALVNGIPEQAGDLVVMPKEQKQYYLAIMQLRLEGIFMPTAIALQQDRAANTGNAMGKVRAKHDQ